MTYCLYFLAKISIYLLLNDIKIKTHQKRNVDNYRQNYDLHPIV